jgi:hypothetical protein
LRKTNVTSEKPVVRKRLCALITPFFYADEGAKVNEFAKGKALDSG